MGSRQNHHPTDLCGLTRLKFSNETHNAPKLHGLRHAYAQRRYFELTKQYDAQHTGWQSPINGGKDTSLLNQQERDIDRRVRAIISRELGHSRIAIVKIYCG